MEHPPAPQMEALLSFAEDVRASLEVFLAPATVCFRGSFAVGDVDQYSDVDVESRVHRALDDRFFIELERHLTTLFGPALIRYDPDFRESTTSQNVRFSFDRLPVFWRLDLMIVSDVATPSKAPYPLPSWDEGTSALMNLVWAIKSDRRGKAELADHYLASACDKTASERLDYSNENVRKLIDSLRRRPDIDQSFLGQVAAALN